MNSKLPIFLLLCLGFLVSCNRKQNNASTTGDVEMLSQRDNGTPGFIPVRTASQKSLFPPSKYEASVDMLEFQKGKEPHKDRNVKIIYPDKGCSSWQECGLNDPNISYFLLTPGDYTDWGSLQLTASGTANKRRIIRYYNPKAANPYNPGHPVSFAGQKGMEVQLENFRLDGGDYWVLHGLTFRGKGFSKKGYTGGLPNTIKHGADHNIINYCLVEKVLGAIAVRLFSSSFNHIQNCVVRDKIRGPGVDMGGIGVSAGYQQESRGNCIVNNEIYNMTDGSGTVRNVNRKGILEKSQIGECPGTVIENNDIYITPDLYVQKGDEMWACAEDGLDIKQGTTSDDPKDRFRIINNRMWGFRPTDRSCGGSGSTGAGIVIHRDARNLLIEGNIIFDVAQGVTVFGVNKKYPDERVENVAIINNLFYDIVSACDAPTCGQAMRLAVGVDAYYNTVANARQLLFVKENRTENRFQCNTFINIEEAYAWERNGRSWSNLNAWYNYPDAKRIYAHQGNSNIIEDKAELEDLEFYVKRWTGPEKIVLP